MDQQLSDTLSPRERQIAKAYANGASYREIAQDLFIAPGTVRKHLNAIYRKLAVSSKIELLKVLECIQDDERADSTGHKLTATASTGASQTAREQTSQPLSQERRQVVLLAAELGFDKQGGDRVDIESMMECFAEFADEVCNEVENAQGHLITRVGQQLIACMGWPTAHEDDAVRAIRAALSIQEATRRLRQSKAFVPQCRIGVATGTIIAGGHSDQAAEPALFVGEALVMAEALLALAQPNQTLITETVRRRIGELFEVRQSETVIDARLGSNQKTFVVQGERVATTRFEARVGATPLKIVGRDEELAVLRKRWRTAKSGEGQAVLVMGEAGIGKSRLVHAFVGELAGEPLKTIHYQCSPNHRQSAFWPIMTRFLAEAGIDSENTSELKRNKLARLLEEAVCEAEAEENMPFIAALIGIDGADPNGIVADLPPQLRRTRTLKALTNYTVGLAERAPLILVYEDIHWADPSTYEWLEQFIETISGRTALILLTSRPADYQNFTGHLHVTQLSINRLDRQGGFEMIQEMAGIELIADQVRDAIVERGDGIPLFIEELTKNALEVNEKSTVNSGLAIPDTLQELLIARLDRLAIDKDILQVAACIGRQFPYKLLAASVAEPEQILRAALDQLVASGLVFLRGKPPESSYLFKHALIRDAVYESLLTSRRYAIHAVLAATIESQYAQKLDEVYESIAFHYSHANRPEKAVEYLVKSATKAVRHYSHREAIDTLQQALIQIDRSNDEQLKSVTADLQLRLAHSHYFVGNFKQSFEIVSDKSNQQRLPSASKVTAEWFFWLGHMSIRYGRPEAAERAARIAIREAEGAGAEGTKGRALGVLVLHSHYFDSAESLRAGIDHAQLSSVLLSNAGEHFWQGMTEFYVGMVYIILGDFRNAEKAARTVSEIGARFKEKRLLAYSGFLNSWVKSSQELYEEAIINCEQALEIAPDPTSKAYVSAFLGYAHLEAGQYSLATPLLRKAAKDFKNFQFRPFEGWFLVLLSESLLGQGATGDAAKFCHQGLNITSEVRYAYGLGWALRCLGRIEKQIGNINNTEQNLRSAAEVFEGIHAEFELARTLRDLSSLINF